MKYIMMTISAFFLSMYCLTAFSDRFVLTGKPVELEYHSGYFTFPSNYRNTIGYRFVMITGTARVCFLTKPSQFAGLDMVQIFIEEDGKQLHWNCYQYNSNDFEIDY